MIQSRMGPTGHSRSIRSFFLSAAVIGIVLAASGCSRQGPLILGFSGCLTERFSDLGIAGRDGALLAVERINSTGGINGRPIELHVKDDENDPARAVTADRELIDAGAEAIIGHMTSGITLTAKAQTDALEIPMLSPTASTEELSGQDDYFFRVIPPNSAEITPLVDYIFDRAGIRTICAAADGSNRAFSFPWRDDFIQRFATAYYPGSETQEYSAFEEAYRERFGREPVFAAMYGYEAVWIVVQALSGENGGGCTSSIKDCLLGKSSYRGLQGDFTLDESGDPVREFQIVRIENGNYRQVF